MGGDAIGNRPASVIDLKDVDEDARAVLKRSWVSSAGRTSVTQQDRETMADRRKQFAFLSAALVLFMVLVWLFLYQGQFALTVEEYVTGGDPNQDLEIDIVASEDYQKLWDSFDINRSAQRERVEANRGKTEKVVKTPKLRNIVSKVLSDPKPDATPPITRQTNSNSTVPEQDDEVFLSSELDIGDWSPETASDNSPVVLQAMGKTVPLEMVPPNLGEVQSEDESIMDKEEEEEEPLTEGDESGNFVLEREVYNHLDKQGCPEGRFITFEPTGNLENKVCQYASMWTLMRLDVTAQPAWILPEMKDEIDQHFTGVRLPMVPPHCSDIKYETISFHLYNREGNTGPDDGAVFLSDHPCHLYKFVRFRRELMQQFRWRPSILEHAQRTLARRTDSMCQSKDQPCTFVGVYVRHVDNQRYLLNKKGASEEVDFYKEAMRQYRSNFTNPVFVVVGDDMAWSRPHLNDTDVIFVDVEGSRPDSQTMALLSQCNHTVITFGNYGMLSAFMAGGHVVIPTGFAPQDKFIHSQLDLARLPYTPISCSDC